MSNTIIGNRKNEKSYFSLMQETFDLFEDFFESNQVFFQKYQKLRNKKDELLKNETHPFDLPEFDQLFIVGEFLNTNSAKNLKKSSENISDKSLTCVFSVDDFNLPEVLATELNSCDMNSINKSSGFQNDELEKLIQVELESEQEISQIYKNGLQPNMFTTEYEANLLLTENNKNQSSQKVNTINHQQKDQSQQVKEMNTLDFIFGKNSQSQVITNHKTFVEKFDHLKTDCYYKEIIIQKSPQKSSTDEIFRLDKNSPTAIEAFANLAAQKETDKKCELFKTFSCLYCSKKFSQRCNLTIHERTHNGEKPFKCQRCNKSFSQLCNLKKHEKIHTGEKSYQCTTCKKTFTQLVSLNKHVRIHTGEKPFSCNICQKTFSQRYSLKCHLNTHSDRVKYSCSKCDKEYLNMNSLRIHEKSHRSNEF